MKLTKAMLHKKLTPGELAYNPQTGLWGHLLSLETKTIGRVIGFPVTIPEPYGDFTRVFPVLVSLFSQMISAYKAEDLSGVESFAQEISWPDWEYCKACGREMPCEHFSRDCLGCRCARESK